MRSFYFPGGESRGSDSGATGVFLVRSLMCSVCEVDRGPTSHRPGPTDSLTAVENARSYLAGQQPVRDVDYQQLTLSMSRRHHQERRISSLDLFRRPVRRSNTLFEKK